jgi:hypothetical protein
MKFNDALQQFTVSMSMLQAHTVAEKYDGGMTATQASMDQHLKLAHKASQELLDMGQHVALGAALEAIDALSWLYSSNNDSELHSKELQDLVEKVRAYDDDVEPNVLLTPEEEDDDDVVMEFTKDKDFLQSCLDASNVG